MLISSLSRQQQKLDWLISQTQRIGKDQVELQAHWGRYLCVLASGFLENAIGEIYSEYAKKCSNEKVATFVQNHVLGIKNPNSSRFIQTTGAFNKGWAEELGEFLSQNGRKEAIDSLMSNRHLIVHGNDSGITVTRVKDYLKKASEVLEFLEEMCGLK